nr:hypothetical protein [Tanacetum cinerariifolium]
MRSFTREMIRTQRGQTSGIPTMDVTKETGVISLTDLPILDYPKCGNPVDGLYFRHCALLRKKLKEQKISKDFLNTFESSNDDSNVVSMPQEPVVFNQDPGENSSQSPPQIDHHCCYECGDSLDGIFCQRCTCKSCGKGAYYGYNCPSKVLIISNLEPCHDQNVEEFPQTLPSFHPTCNSGDENLFAYDSTPSLVNDYPNEIYSNPLFDEEIISIKIDPHHLNAESDLIESLLNQDSSIISSSKIDSLLDEFVGELILLKSIPSGIDEADCDPEEEIRLIEKCCMIIHLLVPERIYF